MHSKVPPTPKPGLGPDADELHVDVHLQRPSCLPGKSAQFLSTIVVNLIAFVFGTLVGWSSVAGPHLTAAGYSDDEQSWVASAVWPAGMAGAAIYAPLADRWGRRRTALLVAVPLLLGWCSLLRDFGFPFLILGRILGGIGMAGVLIVSPMYVGEVVQDSLRGHLNAYMPLFLNAGILFVYAAGAQVGWTALTVLCAAFPALFLVMFVWFPESPVYLLKQGQEREAMKSLAWLHEHPTYDHLSEEMDLMRSTLGNKDTSEASASFGDLIATREARRATLIVLGLVTFQQLSGVTAIINYAAEIFDMAGSTLDPNSAACVVAAVQLFGAALACALIDHTGRLILMYISLIGTSATLAILGCCFYWPLILPGWIPVISLSVFILVYAFGLGPMPFVLLVEVFPPRLRSAALLVTLSLLFSLAFIVSKFFSQLTTCLKPHGSFWLFSMFCALGIVFTKIVIPETCGKSIGEIQVILQGEKKAKQELFVEKV